MKLSPQRRIWELGQTGVIFMWVRLEAREMDGNGNVPMYGVPPSGLL